MMRRQETGTGRAVNRWQTGAALLLAGLCAVKSSGLYFIPSIAYQAAFIGVAFSAFLAGDLARPSYAAGGRRLLTGILIAAIVLTAAYTVANVARLTDVTSALTPPDFWVALILSLACLEVIRRTTGYAFLVIISVGLGYLFLGPYLPGRWGNRGASVDVLVHHLYVGTSGLWGTVTAIATLLVAMYVIFGRLMLETGAAGLLFRFALGIGGRLRGGAGKTALLLSGLFGTMNGSSPANAASTGVFTIPLMIRSGYPRDLAGAIEAVASTGGQIVPPVMGAGAFLIAEFMSTSYGTVMIAAIVPAILYYWAAYFYIDAASGRLGIGAIGSSQDTLDGLAQDPGRPAELSTVAVGQATWRSALKLIAPFAVLVTLIVQGRSAQFAAFWATAVALAAMAVLDWESWPQTRAALARVGGVLGRALPVLAELAALGVASQMLVSIIGLSGIGPKVAGLVLDVSGNSLFLALVLTGLVVTVLGMGVATTADFVIASAVLGPALVQLGAGPLAMYLFIFFFACSSSLTPPVCAAAFVSAGIAGANWVRVAFRACVLAVGIFIVPFLFVYRPALLLQRLSPAGWAEIGMTFLALFALSVSFGGWLRERLTVLERVLLLVGGALLLYRLPAAMAAGATVVALVVAVHVYRVLQDARGTFAPVMSIEEQKGG